MRTEIDKIVNSHRDLNNSKGMFGQIRKSKVQIRVVKGVRIGNGKIYALPEFVLVHFDKTRYFL